MGLFDWLRVDAPLPTTLIPPPPGTLFQTKDTPDQYMTLYWITADGALMWRPYEFVEVPKAERPHPNDEGALGLAGCLRRVEQEPQRVDYHGDIYFGHLGEPVTPGDYRTAGLWNYRARFTEGTLARIEVDEFRAPGVQTE